MPEPPCRGRWLPIVFGGEDWARSRSVGQGAQKRPQGSFPLGLWLARILPSLSGMHEAQVVEFGGYLTGDSLLTIRNQENNRSDGWRI